MRLTLPFTFAMLAVVGALLAFDTAGSAQALRLNDVRAVRTMRDAADHYRSIAWTYERAARRPVTPTSYSYRRSRDHDYLQWTVSRWEHTAYGARLSALVVLKRRLGLRLPQGPALHASLAKRVAYQRALALRLRGIYPGSPARALTDVRRLSARQQFLYWQRRAAEAAYAVSRHATRLSVIAPRWLADAFLCIHRYEGAWTDDTGNGYYGGLQMDYGFMRRYGSGFLRRWGTADNWPAWAQLQAAVRAYRSGRGFAPWPNTAAACRLL